MQKDKSLKAPATKKKEIMGTEIPGCKVVGIDIAELSIEEAKERAKRQGVSDKAKFRAGDAYALPFEAGTFDAVITEFVSQFLDRKRAFKEFARVLKPGAYVGINEMCREKEILAKAAEEIAQAEKNWRNNRASVFPVVI